MLSILCYLSVRTFIAVAAATSITAPPQTSHAPFPPARFHNAFYSESSVNEHLTITPQYDESRRLSSDQVYLCTLEALMKCAKSAATSSRAPLVPTLFSSAMYPNIAIQITSTNEPPDSPGNYILTMLALYRILSPVKSPLDPFYPGKHFLLWDGKLFGMIQYDLLTPDHWREAETHGLNTAASLPVYSVTSAISFPSLRLERPLRNTDVFHCLAKTMLYLALRFTNPDVAAPLPIQMTSESEPPVGLSIGDHRRRRPGRGEARLTTLGAMESLVQVANGMIRRDGFTEVRWDVRDSGGVVVATGVLGRASGMEEASAPQIYMPTSRPKPSGVVDHSAGPSDRNGVLFDIIIHDRLLQLPAGIGTDPSVFLLVVQSSSPYTWVNSQKTDSDPGALGNARIHQ